MVYILHIDTSAEKGIVALAADGKLLSLIENTDPRSHASTINIHVAALLEKHGIGLKDISAFCVCGGPGSYTGLRIGLATAKGYCYATGARLMMHNRLLLMAASVQGTHATANRLPVLKAREGEYFSAVYDSDLSVISEPRHYLEHELLAHIQKATTEGLLIGFEPDNIDSIARQSSHPFTLVSNLDYHAWAAYAFRQLNCNEIVITATAEPFYLKQVHTHNKKIIS